MSRAGARHTSAICLARANVASLEMGNALFEYYLGVDGSGAARWSNTIGTATPVAVPLGDDDDAACNRVGELGALYEPESKCFVLCFYNYSIGHPLPSYYCAASREPAAGWSQPQLIFNGSEPWYVRVGHAPFLWLAAVGVRIVLAHHCAPGTA